MLKSCLAHTLTVLLSCGAVVRAEQEDAATRHDLDRLQDELANLDEMLQGIDVKEPSHAELQQRVDWLREDVSRLDARLREAPRGDERLAASRKEVERLRSDAAALQKDVARGYEEAADGEVPQGTAVLVRLDAPLSSQTARREDRVAATVTRPVAADGRVLIPAGSRVEGLVREAAAAERPSRAGRLDLEFERVHLRDGRTVPMASRVVSIEEDRFSRRSAERAGIGAILGGVLGAAVGGRRTTVLGVIVGAAGGLAASAGQDVELPEGALLTLRLERPLLMANAPR